MKTLESNAVILASLAVLVYVATPAVADWPGHEVKWDQMDEDATYAVFSSIDADAADDTWAVADDFLCSESAWISDIEFAGRFWANSQLDGFRVTFWSDVPATPDDESHPGDLLYEKYFLPAEPADPHKIGWQNLGGTPEGNNAYRINIAEEDWFWQDVDNVYWISIQGVMADNGAAGYFMWALYDRYLDTWGDDAAIACEYYGLDPWWNIGWQQEANPTPEYYDGPFPDGWWKSAGVAFALTGIPEPGTLGLLALGAGLVAGSRRRRRH